MTKPCVQDPARVSAPTEKKPTAVARPGSTFATGLVVLTVLGAPALSAAQPSSGTSKSVLLLPYQPILHSVPQVTVDRIAGHLERELSQVDGLTNVGATTDDSAAEPPSLGAAEDHRQQAREAERAKDIREAVLQRKRAVEAIERNAAALNEVDPYVEALHRWARALMWSGDDQAAKAAMARAVRIAPAHPLPSTDFSRLYRRWSADIAQTALRAPRTRLQVQSALPGATIGLDGREMGTAPVLIDGLVPGRHWVSANVEGRPPFGIFVDVDKSGAQTYVASFSDPAMGENARAVLNAVIANALPPTAVTAAVAAGRRKGAAFVVAGGVVADQKDDDLNVHTVVVDVARRRVKPLPAFDFDAELLTAESDVVQIVQAIQETIRHFEGGASTLDRLEARPPAAVRRRVTRADGAPTEPGAEPRSPRQDGRRRVFQANEGGEVQIDDR